MGIGRRDVPARALIIRDLVGNMKESDTPRLTEVCGLVERGNPRVLFDLDDLKSVQPRVLRELVRVCLIVENDPAVVVRFCGVGPEVRQKLEEAGIGSGHFFETEAEALANFGAVELPLLRPACRPPPFRLSADAPIFPTR